MQCAVLLLAIFLFSLALQMNVVFCFSPIYRYSHDDFFFFLSARFFPLGIVAVVFVVNLGGYFLIADKVRMPKARDTGAHRRYVVGAVCTHSTQ